MRVNGLLKSAWNYKSTGGKSTYKIMDIYERYFEAGRGKFA